ncbi:F-box/LRR-repeat protein At3g59200-like [Silene latifolia]|uniref:F-box/LRR-repeat protein At3g59200-like n=1 Tax=Silene latifolia TaxID=37657 RepID=UPI003D77F577
MMVDRKKATFGQLDTKDRISDLPDSIIHHIISFLGTEEACRTTILSKRWIHIWSTGLILDFRPQFFVPKKDGVFVDGYLNSIEGPYDTKTIERLVNFIEITMQRYSEKNLSIRNLKLEYPTIDQEICGRIDGWLGIALRNQVEELSLYVIPEGSPSYGLPAILFLAKSLINLTFCRVRVPHFENLKLSSLQSLVMTEVNIDENMLQDIIMSMSLENFEA